MEEGALGLGSSLIYAPGSYAGTDELIALVKVVAEYDGMYVSHLRSEGNQLLPAVDEFLRIAREGGVRAEIYHLKAAGRANWPKLGRVLDKLEAARAAGLPVTANMYTYTSAATGLDASMPPSAQAGGREKWFERLSEPVTRARLIQQMRTPSAQWENLYLDAGSPQNVMLVSFRTPELKRYVGRTVAEVAKERGRSPEDTVIDLILEDRSNVKAIYFLMSEDNVRTQLRRSWISFGSDATAPAAEGVFLQSNPHPRAYGNVARLLGHYVRDERVISLPEAVRRMTSLPAANLRILDRGALKKHYFADLVIFDPQTVADRASYEHPHVYATGIKHVIVNGVPVIAAGQHTGARPGRFVRGPGWNHRATDRAPTP
jgi:N-acyl-D-amino-acid deacylase